MEKFSKNRTLEQYEDVEQDDSKHRIDEFTSYPSQKYRYQPFSIQIRNRFSCMILVALIVLLFMGFQSLKHDQPPPVFKTNDRCGTRCTRCNDGGKIFKT